jgi:NifU-like protein involved in Fe-S cluster formation
MIESPEVIDHYSNPRNVGSLPGGDRDVGTGTAGSVQGGAVVRLQIRVDARSGRIAEARFKTFGCGFTIASSSLATERLTGLPLADAPRVSADAIAAELRLPDEKRHAAAVVAEAVGRAVADYQHKQR